MTNGIYQCRRCGCIKKIPYHIGPEICSKCGAIMVWINDYQY